MTGLLGDRGPRGKSRATSTTDQRFWVLSAIHVRINLSDTNVNINSHGGGIAAMSSQDAKKSKKRKSMGANGEGGAGEVGIVMEESLGAGPAFGEHSSRSEAT